MDSPVRDTGRWGAKRRERAEMITEMTPSLACRKEDEEMITMNILANANRHSFVPTFSWGDSAKTC
jgi:hypothetical protein